MVLEMKLSPGRGELIPVWFIGVTPKPDLCEIILFHLYEIMRILAICFAHFKKSLLSYINVINNAPGIC